MVFRVAANWGRRLAQARYAALCVGVGACGLAAATTAAWAERNYDVLSKKDFRSVEVESVANETHNVKRVRFALPSKEDELGLDAISCVMVRTIGEDGKAVVRPYNPVWTGSLNGAFELAVKKYDGAKMGSFLHSRSPGDKVEIKGPFVQYKYEPNQYKHITLVAGGTGITPMMQLIQQIFRNPEDKTKVVLLYANRSEQDIIFRRRLDKLAQAAPERFEVHYVVEDAPEGWKGTTGRMDLDFLKTRIPAPSDDSFVLVCGPAGMMETISGTKNPDRSQGELRGVLRDIGFSSANVRKL